MKNLLIIDPAQNTPECGSINKISAIKEKLAENGICSISGLRLYMPCLSPDSICEMKAEKNIGAVIVFGSASNVTDPAPWMIQFENYLKNDIIEKGIPFLGICFAHQLVAHAYGFDVGFIPNRESLPEKKHCDFRSVQVSHPFMRLLLTRWHESQPGDNSKRDHYFKTLVTKSVDWKNSNWELFWNDENSRKEEDEELWNFLTRETSAHFWSQGKHEQEVRQSTSASSNLIHAGSSGKCVVEAFVHNNQPTFTLQTHPETDHHSGDGARLIQNFLYLANILSSIKS